MNEKLKTLVKEWMAGRRRQRELAGLAGVSMSAISEWINGKMNLTIPVFEKISTAIGIQWVPEKQSSDGMRRCPFCGSEVQTVQQIGDDETKFTYAVECVCGIRGPVTEWYRDEEIGQAAAIALWNWNGK